MEWNINQEFADEGQIHPKTYREEQEQEPRHSHANRAEDVSGLEAVPPSLRPFVAVENLSEKIGESHTRGHVA
jgi:hypothetical protein